MIKFRVLNIRTKRIIRDSSQYNVTVDRNDGFGTVNLSDPDLRALLFTGEKTVDGVEVYDGDIVEAIVTTTRGQEAITDHVHWHDAAWRFGNFNDTLAELVIRSVKGNVFESPWPAGRPLS